LEQTRFLLVQLSQAVTAVILMTKRSADAAKEERRKSWVDPLFRCERDTRPKSVWDPVLGTGYHLQRTEEQKWRQQRFKLNAVAMMPRSAGVMTPCPLLRRLRRAAMRERVLPHGQGGLRWGVTAPSCVGRTAP
jgi:hypothetical protein